MKRAITRDCDDRSIPDAFDVVCDTYDRNGCSIAACHRCWLDIQMRSYPQLVQLRRYLVALLVIFTESTSKAAKRAITRDYDARNMPDVFDLIYDTYGRDGCSINACHCCWLDVQMRSYPQESRSLEGPC